MGKIGGFVKGEVRRAIHDRRDEIREAISTGYGEKCGWRIEENEKLLRPSFTWGEYLRFYYFGGRKEE